MKKIISIALLAILGLMMVSCNKPPQPDTTGKLPIPNETPTDDTTQHIKGADGNTLAL